VSPHTHANALQEHDDRFERFGKLSICRASMSGRHLLFNAANVQMLMFGEDIANARECYERAPCVVVLVFKWLVVCSHAWLVRGVHALFAGSRSFIYSLTHLHHTVGIVDLIRQMAQDSTEQVLHELTR
jgi:hypothetical protein